MVIEHVDAQKSLPGVHPCDAVVHVRQRNGFDRPCDEPASIAAGQVHARHQPPVTADTETSQVAHAGVLEVTQAIEDQASTDPLDSGRHMGVVPDDEIDAGLAHRLIAKPSHVLGRRAHLHLLTVVNREYAELRGRAGKTRERVGEILARAERHLSGTCGVAPTAISAAPDSRRGECDHGRLDADRPSARGVLAGEPDARRGAKSDRCELGQVPNGVAGAIGSIVEGVVVGRGDDVEAGRDQRLNPFRVRSEVEQLLDRPDSVVGRDHGFQIGEIEIAGHQGTDLVRQIGEGNEAAMPERALGARRLIAAIEPDVAGEHERDHVLGRWDERGGALDRSHVPRRRQSGLDRGDREAFATGVVGGSRPAVNAKNPTDGDCREPTTPTHDHAPNRPLER